MRITGRLIIGSKEVSTENGFITGFDPTANEPIDINYHMAGKDEINEACELADAAFDEYRSVSPSKRAIFLRQIAEEISVLGDELVNQVVSETGLLGARVIGERARTVNQLMMFADMLDFPNWKGARLDTEDNNRFPPRPNIRYKKIAIGPAVVFGASNFPLAFSVAGGDTASALAAGCPVIVKAHTAHLGTSWLVGKAIQQAAQKTGMPEGVFSLIFGKGNEVGTALVSHPLIKAVGFTGSKAGGLALMEASSKRKEPIPVYAEMSSINPSFFFERSLTEENAIGLVNSLTQGAGQFCTNPGLVFVVKSEASDLFLKQVAKQVQLSISQTMLTPSIYEAYKTGLERAKSSVGVDVVAEGQESHGENQCKASLLKVSFSDYLDNDAFKEEIFGASTLIVECNDYEEFLTAAKEMPGQLTCSVHCTPHDPAMIRSLIQQLEKKAGRLIVNGFPTGVEVCHSMVHGGPFPSTSDSRTTSVGATAIDRFLRPVCYQGFPANLLPNDLVAMSEFQYIDGKPT